MVQVNNLAPQFWVEVINCANYILNHASTKSIMISTPKEAWYKIKPNASHFKNVWL
jgi:hypothetical protein